MSQEKNNFNHSFSGVSVLVTGGAGFIGSHVAAALLSQGARVTILDSLHPRTGANLKNIETIRKDIRWVQKNVCDWESLKPYVKEADYLFNCVGQSSHKIGMSDPLFDLECNLISVIGILEACRHFNPTIRLVHLSSRHVYGRPDSLPVSEKAPIQPFDTYGVHKRGAEEHCRLYQENHGIWSVLLRLTNIFGPCQNKTDVAGLFFRKAAKGESLPIFGKGDQLRDFLDVEDASKGILLAATLPEKQGGIYNVGGKEPVSLLDFAKKIAKVSGVGIEHFPYPKEAKMIEAGDVHLDSSLFTAATGWRPEISLDKGIERAFHFFKENISEYDHS